ncbi:MAG: LysR family transcriptional regulator [Chloroflexi bacterium]|nr:LysR family transcriptional regulator [Chloroflexota bacterium]
MGSNGHHSTTASQLPFELQALYIFLIAAQTQSFSEAGRRLCLSQSAVSQHIRSLEQQLNTQLFERHGRGVSLTNAGLLLMPMAREIVALARHINETMDNVESRLVGTLRMACGDSTCNYFIPTLMSRFGRLYPDVRMIFQSRPGQEIANLLLNGQVDLGLLGAASSHPDITLLPFFRDEIRLIVPIDHPFAAREKVELRDLLDQPFISQHASCGCYYSISRELAKRHLSLDDFNIIMEISDPEAIIRAVSQGVALSFGSMLLASAYVDLGMVKLLEVSGLTIFHQAFFAYNSTVPDTTVRDKFLAFVQHPQSYHLMRSLTPVSMTVHP